MDSLSGVYRKNLLIPFAKMVLDVVTVIGAILFSYWLRFYSPLTYIFPVTKGYPPLHGYLYFSFFLAVVYLILFSIFNSYRSRFFPSFSEDIPIVLKTNVVAILIAMSAAFLYRGFSYSRLVFFLIFVNTTILLLIQRLFFHHFKKIFLKKGYNIFRLLLVGTKDQMLSVAQKINPQSSALISLEGYLSESPIEELQLPYQGKISDLLPLIEQGKFDGILVAFDHADHPKLLKILKMTEGKNLEIFYVPDILDIFTSNVRQLEINGLPVLQLKTFSLSGWQGLVKRSFDLIVSAAGLVILSPLFALIAMVIKLTSRGPVFYKQPRVTMDGREFTMLKFRSMYVDAEARTGPVWASKNDPRVTPIGRFLRRTSLDELPQLINVLKGDMSLVGPRPERRYFVEQFQRTIPHYSERHRVRCGMTGWAQVNGLRGQSPIEERTRYDLYYIENWSLWFDIKIIILTFIAILKGENAY